jgi:FkbM family methyltransferase
MSRRTSEARGRPRADAVLETWLRGPNHPAKLRMFSWVIRNLRGGCISLKVSSSRLFSDIDDYIGRELIYKGEYEPNSLSLCRKLMAGGGVFVDIGANIGLYSLIIGEIDDIKVISFEPDSYNFSRLKKNVALNARQNIILCNFPLSDSAQIVPFYVPFTDNGGTARIPDLTSEYQTHARSHYSAPATLIKPEHHATARLDDVAKMLDLNYISLLKIDVEGHELQVLRGLDWNKSYKPHNILCEYIDDHSGKEFIYFPTELSAFLEERGYVASNLFGEELSAGDSIPESNVWFRCRSTS